MSQKHTYSKRTYGAYPYHIVHMDGTGKVGSAVAGADRTEDAQSDADVRNKRAHEYKLDCKYVVRKQEEGTAITEEKVA